MTAAAEIIAFFNREASEVADGGEYSRRSRDDCRWFRHAARTFSQTPRARNAARQAMIPLTTLPCTSVRR